MSYKFISVSIALLSFVISFYALSSIKFEKFTQVDKPAKVQSLLIVLSFALAGLVANFLMMFINF